MWRHVDEFKIAPKTSGKENAAKESKHMNRISQLYAELRNGPAVDLEDDEGDDEEVEEEEQGQPNGEDTDSKLLFVSTFQLNNNY